MLAIFKTQIIHRENKLAQKTVITTANVFEYEAYASIWELNASPPWEKHCQSGEGLTSETEESS